MAGNKDQEIAAKLTSSKGEQAIKHSTVRKQVSNLYEYFDLRRNYAGNESPRQQLISLFSQHSSQLIQDGFGDYVPYNQMPPPEPPPFVLTGCLSLDSPYYMERSIDDEIRRLFSTYRTTPDKSVLCLRVTGSKGMGKSSLLVRMQRYLKENEDHFVAKVNLKEPQFSDCLGDFKALLYRFTYLVARALRPALETEPTPLKDHWDEAIVPGINATDYLQDLFEKIQQPKTLIIDGIDAILDHESTYAQFSEFLRYWFENKMKWVSAEEVVWPHIIMAYSTEPYANLSQPLGSPLQNVGISLALPEFTPAQVKAQAHRFGLQWDDATVTEVMKWVGGHPDLVNRTLHHLAVKSYGSGAVNAATIQHFFEDAVSEVNRNFDDYLFKNLDLLKRNKRLRDFFIKTLQEEPWRDEFTRFQLEKVGLVKIEGDQLLVRFRLYEEYFKIHLTVDNHDA
jgi:hypothetical protein